MNIPVICQVAIELISAIIGISIICTIINRLTQVAKEIAALRSQLALEHKKTVELCEMIHGNVSRIARGMEGQ